MSTVIQFLPNPASATTGKSLTGTIIVRNGETIASPELEIGLVGREEIVFFASKGYATSHAELPGIPPVRVDLTAECGAGSLTPGEHQLPISLALPPSLVPTFPNEKSFRSVGLIPSEEDEGLYVEYWLAIVLRTGLLSHTRVEIPVTLKSLNFQLGWIPQSDIIGQTQHAIVRLYFPSREVRAGETLSFRWAVRPIRDGENLRVAEVGFGLRIDAVGGIYGHLREFRRVVVSYAPGGERDAILSSGTANLPIPAQFADVSGQQGTVYLSSWEVYLNIEHPHAGALVWMAPSLEAYYVPLGPPTAVESSSTPPLPDSLSITSEETPKTGLP